MQYFSPYYFESLKRKLLETTGYTNPIPANCKTISALIEEKTKQKISETTLKRLFGFAFSKFQPSLFTLDVISRFCGYRSWTNFCEAQEELTKSPEPLAVRTSLDQNASKITQFTLQALKNKSGIPYYQTIDRSFINDHLNLFINGDYKATVIAAPAGYGKTIALCHWIEEKSALKSVKNSDDTFLFFSMHALMNVFFTGRDLNEWLLALLGYSSEQDIVSFLETKQRNKGYFFLVIDGLDDYTFKNDQFHLILNQIMDIFSFYRQYPWFKLILSMRSATLANNYHLFDYENPTWFKGFVTSESEVTNVPLFNISEIRRLCSKLNPNIKHAVDVETANKINYPLYFQIYYKSQKDDFTLKKIDQVQIHDVVSSFIQNKIYMGANSIEKMQLIDLLWSNLDFKNQTYTVNKLDIDAEIKKHKNAYNELLSIGYIKEVNKSSDFNYVTQIHFGNRDFLSYTIAGKLLNGNNVVFNDHLVRSINSLFQDNPIKVSIIKWAIIHASKSGQSIDFELLHKLNFNPNEKADMIIFLGDLFKKEFSGLKNLDSVNKFFLSDYSFNIFNYFLGLEFITPEYKKALTTLLHFNLPNKGEIFLYCSLAIIAIVEMDMTQLEEQLKNLKKNPPEEYEIFPVNPLICLEAIHYYLKYGIVRQEGFAMLTKFYANPQAKKTTGDKNIDDVLYLLAVYTLSIYEKADKTMKLVNFIENTHAINTGDLNTGYSLLLNIATADINLTLGKIENALNLYRKISEGYYAHKQHYTPFMRALFYLLRIKANMFTGRNDDALNNIQCLLNLTEQNDYKLIKLNTILFTLENQASLDLPPDFYKMIHHDYITLIRESGFSRESFTNNTQLIV